MHFDAILSPKRASSSPFACARVMLNDVRTPAIFINSKPRFGLAGGSQSPLSGADAPCPARRRGSSWGEGAGRKPRAAVRQQGRRGRARPGFAMLSVPTLWTVFVINFLALGLIWAYVMRSYPSFEAARFWTGSAFAAAAGAALAMLRVAVPGFARAAAVRRHRADAGDLPGRDGDPEILRPAGVVARHRADHRPRLRRPVASSSSSTTACPARMTVFTIAQALPMVLSLKLLLSPA